MSLRGDEVTAAISGYRKSDNKRKQNRKSVYGSRLRKAIRYRKSFIEDVTE